MVYVTSDLHGTPLPRFQALLDKAGFGDDDFLFILGDVIDRGEHGIELLSWISQMPNMELILGNHESMMLSCEFLFENADDVEIDDLEFRQLFLFDNWMRNGAQPTIRGAKALLKEDPELFQGILDYLHEAPLFRHLNVNGQEFLLVHAGISNFDPTKPLECYEPNDLLWSRPSLDTRYYDDVITVFGHTPTLFFGPQFENRAARTDTWICIDTGAAGGRPPMVLRLDDLQETYL